HEMAKLLEKKTIPEQHLSKSYAVLTNIWLKNDPIEASRWVDSLEQGTARDVASSMVISYLSKNNDHESGFHWALSIKDKNQRERSLKHTITQLQTLDPQKAAQLANSPDLTPKETEELKKMLEKE